MDSKKPDTDPLQQLVYGISHDMGASLRAVIRFSELLQNNLTDRLTERERYWLELVHDGGSKAQSMVDSLLVYSRLDTQADPASLVNLDALLQQCLDSVLDEQKINVDQLTIERDISPVSVPVVCSHWRQIFMSILDNAVRYHPLAQEHQRYLKISLAIQAGAITFSCDDNGIGMSEEHRLNAARPFMRAVAEKEYPGIGMGLSYCDRIGQLNQGELSISESALGGIRTVYQQRLTIDG